MRKLLYISLTFAVVTVTLWALTPPTLGAATSAIDLPQNLDAWLQERESLVDAEYGLVPDTQKRIRWQQTGVPTPIAIVNLHGFSATRQEVAPTAEIIADALEANLFETRLTGHGRQRSQLEGMRAEDWLRDGREALAIGNAIGDEIVLIGTSTGATLALSMLGEDAMRNVRAIVLISPNILPADPTAEWITRPAGPLLLRLIAGDTHSFEPYNEQQAIFWTTSYPTAAIVEVMRLADRVASLLSTPVDHEILMLLAPADQVVSTSAAREAFELLDSPRKQLVDFPHSEDPAQHILSGDIMSPSTTQPVADMIVDFIRGDEQPPDQ